MIGAGKQGGVDEARSPHGRHMWCEAAGLVAITESTSDPHQRRRFLIMHVTRRDREDHKLHAACLVGAKLSCTPYS